MSDIAGKRQDDSEENLPIVFVGHSLGGFSHRKVKSKRTKDCNYDRAVIFTGLRLCIPRTLTRIVI